MKTQKFRSSSLLATMLLAAGTQMALGAPLNYNIYEADNILNPPGPNNKDNETPVTQNVPGVLQMAITQGVGQPAKKVDTGYLIMLEKGATASDLLDPTKWSDIVKFVDNKNCSLNITLYSDVEGQGAGQWPVTAQFLSDGIKNDSFAVASVFELNYPTVYQPNDPNLPGYGFDNLVAKNPLQYTIFSDVPESLSSAWTGFLLLPFLFRRYGRR